MIDYEFPLTERVRTLLRLGLWWRTQQAHQRFAGGVITGVQLAEELAAYSLLKRL